MNLVHDTTIVAEGLARLLEVFKGKPRIAALLTSWLQEFQAVEDAAFEIYILRLLQNGLATGDLLDKIGKIVGQLREGFNDAEYLILILARIRAERSVGVRPDLLAIASLLAPGLPIVAKNLPPASFYISPFGPLPVPPQIAGPQFLSIAASAGILLMFIWTQQAAVDTLTFGSVWGGVVPGPTQSFGSVYITGIGGGVAAGAIEVEGGAA